MLTPDAWLWRQMMSAAYDHEPGRHHAPPDLRLATQHAPEQTQRLAERVQRLEALLVAKGLVVPETLEALASMYENDIGPMNGARVVARAWTDPAYKQRLLTNATVAIAELGISGLQGEHMVDVRRYRLLPCFGSGTKVKRRAARSIE
jgi:nitrile hydratase